MAEDQNWKPWETRVDVLRDVYLYHGPHAHNFTGTARGNPVNEDFGRPVRYNTYYGEEGSFVDVTDDDTWDDSSTVTEEEVSEGKEGTYLVSPGTPSRASTTVTSLASERTLPESIKFLTEDKAYSLYDDDDDDEYDGDDFEEESEDVNSEDRSLSRTVTRTTEGRLSTIQERSITEEHIDAVKAENEEQNKGEHIEEQDGDEMNQKAKEYYKELEYRRDSKMPINEIEIFTLARRGKFLEIGNMVRRRTDFKLDIKDEIKKTVLHYAANYGDIVMAQEALRRGAGVNDIDKLGLTPLHYVSTKGHPAVARILVANGADVDMPDLEKGRTPLHLCCLRNHVQTATVLLNRGADPSTKDMDGSTPFDLCHSEQMRLELSKYERISGLGGIQQQTVQIASGEQKELQDLGVTVDYTLAGKPSVLTLMIRRIPIEISMYKFDLAVNEDLCSDIFECRLIHSVESIRITLTVLICKGPWNDEELVMRTAGGLEIECNDFQVTDEKTVLVRVTEEIGKLGTFAFVTKPRREEFSVGPEAITIYSAVDERVELNFPDQAFEEPTKITMEIASSPTDSRASNSVLETSTPFYSVISDGGQPTKPVEFKLPLPENYKRSGKILVASMDDEDENESEDSWTIMNKVARVENDRVVFKVDSFSVKVAFECNFNFQKEKDVKRHLSVQYRKARHRQHLIKFLMSRAIPGTDSFDLCIECCHNVSIEHSKNQRYMEGFQDGHVTERPFSAQSKQEYRITVSGNVKMSETAQNAMLTFHPKRQNKLCVRVTLKALQEDSRNFMEIFQLMQRAHYDQTGGDVILLEKVSLDFQTETMTFHNDFVKSESDLEQDISKMRKMNKAKKERKVVPPGEVFTDDVFILSFSKKMDDDWCRLLVLMEIPFADIETTLEHARGHFRDKIIELLFNWRDKHLDDADLGIPVILSALRKGGRRDLSTKLEINLKAWFSEPNNRSKPFYQWLERAYKNSDMLIPGDYARPMSDPYLVLVEETMSPSQKLAQELQLSSEEYEDIINNLVYSTDAMKLTKMLTLFRTKVSDEAKSLECLVQTLKKLNMTKAAKSAVAAVRDWVKRTAKADDPLKNSCVAILKKFK